MGGVAPPRVAILLATFNGDRFLAQQLATIENQSLTAIDIFASDDGSSDGTLSLLQAASRSWTKGRLTIQHGPSRGYAENFRSLLARRDIDADFVAFSDQDDIWRPEKLSVAVSWLNRQPSDVPALYCSRTENVDEQGGSLGLSPLFKLKPGLRNALVQSIAGGNTMVVNRPAFALLSESARRTAFVSHDWWAYLLVTAAGGLVHYSPRPEIGYRQHTGNVIGGNDSWNARIGRINLLLAGRFQRWTDSNLAGLDACADLLPADSLTVIDRFRKLRSAPLQRRLSELRRLGLHRQTWLGQVSLYAASLLKRL